MKLSNFRDYKQVGDSALTRREYGVVDVTTGFLWWKRTVPMQVGKSYYSIYWKFVDTGEFTPNHTVESLFDSYRMKNDLSL